MRCAVAILSAIALLAIPACAQNKFEVEDLAHHPFAVAFPAGGQIKVHVRSADIHIVGSDANSVAVRVGGRQGSESTDMKLRLERTGDYANLEVTGGPSSEVAVFIEVPKKSNLVVRIFAGNVEIGGVNGNKDIELSAGNLTVGVGNAADYGHVEASVSAGAIDARPFGESRGGLFRSFEKSGGGRYTLTAHVGTGNLTLN